MSQTSSNSQLKAYDRCIEATEAYLKVSDPKQYSKAVLPIEKEKKCDICGMNLDGAESHRSTSSIGKTTFLCPKCQEDILASNRMLSETSTKKWTERVQPTSALSIDQVKSEMTVPVDLKDK